MNKNTPVIMGLLLIIGIAALGYFADLDKQDNDSANNSTNYSLLKYQNLTNKTASDTIQPSKSSDKSSKNTTEQNNTNITSSNNRTASSTE